MADRPERALVLATARLSLRELADADAPFLVELLNDPDWLRHIGDRGVRTEEDARAYVANGPAASYARHGYGLWCVERTVDRTPLGICGLLKRDALPEPDLGFAFLPAARGRGYAHEAAGATLAHGRAAFGMRRVLAITSPDNAVSGRLLLRLGFRDEGVVRLAPDGAPLRLYASDPPAAR